MSSKTVTEAIENLAKKLGANEAEIEASKTKADAIDLVSKYAENGGGGSSKLVELKFEDGEQVLDENNNVLGLKFELNAEQRDLVYNQNYGIKLYGKRRGLIGNEEEPDYTEFIFEQTNNSMEVALGNRYNTLKFGIFSEINGKIVDVQERYMLLEIDMGVFLLRKDLTMDFQVNLEEVASNQSVTYAPVVLNFDPYGGNMKLDYLKRNCVFVIACPSSPQQSLTFAFPKNLEMDIIQSISEFMSISITINNAKDFFNYVASIYADEPDDQMRKIFLNSLAFCSLVYYGIIYQIAGSNFCSNCIGYGPDGPNFGSEYFNSAVQVFITGDKISNLTFNYIEK